MRSRSYVIIILIIVVINHEPLHPMEQENSFILFDDRLALDFRKKLVTKVIKHVDDMSYIGQANKACYAEIKRQQIKYIAKMHRLQDPSLIRVNVPPFVFFEQTHVRTYRRKCAVDPNSREFYEKSTIDKLPLSTAIANANTDKYERIIRPTDLLIACLEQNKEEVERLLPFYPLHIKQIIPNDPQSEKLCFDRCTKELFLDALSASNMIRDNKIFELVHKHRVAAEFTEEALAESIYAEKFCVLSSDDDASSWESNHLGNFQSNDLPDCSPCHLTLEEREKLSSLKMLFSFMGQNLRTLKDIGSESSSD